MCILCLVCANTVVIWNQKTCYFKDMGKSLPLLLALAFDLIEVLGELLSDGDFGSLRILNSWWPHE